MHAQLRQAGVDGSHPRFGAEHGPDRASTTDVVPDLEDLQGLAGSVGTFLQDLGAQAVGGRVTVGIGLDGDAGVEEGTVVGEVDVHEIWIECMSDVG